MSKQMEIAVRLFENQKFGTTYAKGKYHSALFNGTVDVKNTGIKYLLDLHSLANWRNTAKSDMEMQMVRESIEVERDVLYSYIKRYDINTKQKTDVYGMAVFDTNKNSLSIVIVDSENDIEEFWELNVKTCRAVTGKNAPQLLATNSDLTEWKVAA